MCRFLCIQKFSHHLGKNLDVRFLDLTVTLCSALMKLPNCLSKWLYHLAFPPARNELLNILTKICSVSVLDFNHSSRYAVISHSGIFSYVSCHPFIFGDMSLHILITSLLNYIWFVLPTQQQYQNISYNCCLFLPI